MARARTAYLNRADVPDRAALQAALDAFKLKLVLDDGYVPLETSGYLPCTLHGEDAGFTLRFRDVGEDGGKYPALAPVLGARDVAADIKWTGDIREEVSAMAVLAALAGAFGAVVHDSEKDALIEAKKLLSRAKEGAEEL